MQEAFHTKLETLRSDIIVEPSTGGSVYQDWGQNGSSNHSALYTTHVPLAETAPSAGIELGWSRSDGCAYHVVLVDGSDLADSYT